MRKGKRDETMVTAAVMLDIVTSFIRQKGGNEFADSERGNDNLTNMAVSTINREVGKRRVMR